jgi:uncharacterized membrane protein YjfL (UPF0719 family)
MIEHMWESLGFAVATLVVLLLVARPLRRPWRRLLGHSAGARLVEAAEVFGVFLTASRVVRDCVLGDSLTTDATWTAVFGIAALAAFELCAWLGVRAFAAGAIARAVGGDNTAAALLAAGHVAATGILAGNLFVGTSWQDLGIALAFFAIAQLSLHVLMFCFRRLTAYDDMREVLGGNVAAALSHAGLGVALALLIAHAADGEYRGFAVSLRAYAVALAEGLLIYPLRQAIVQTVILGARPSLFGGELDRAIAERRDLGTGALEAATYVAAALLARSCM